MNGSNSKLQQLERDELEAMREKTDASEEFGKVSDATDNFPIHSAASQRLSRAEARLEEVRHQIAVLKSQSD